MKKENLLKQIAEKGYDVGFGAKKHFATYDIVEKTPGLIGFSSMATGILGLVFEIFSTKGLSASFLILGIIVFYIERYNEAKEKYAEKGKVLIKLFNELKALYYKVESSSENENFLIEQELLENISIRFYENSLDKQILFSDWYAHYKFFWQHQIGWIEEQKQFRLWRDKIPLSFTFAIFIILACLGLYYAKWKGWI